MYDCSECLCVDVWWSSIDGEQYFGEQDQYFDNKQDQQEKFEQGKYSLGSSLLSHSLFITLIICMSLPW
jgi:hypothetical protein